MKNTGDENNKEIRMSKKAARKGSLGDLLSRFREINISVTGRKSGHTISIPIWFVADDEKLYFLPVNGSDTQWYKNVLKKPSIRVKADGAEVELKVVPVSDTAQVSSVIEKFRAKYGEGGIKLYSKLDVAVLGQMP
jgi:deazaflavin-dependent oxidoreductase (nitroreductase family)